MAPSAGSGQALWAELKETDFLLVFQTYFRILVKPVIGKD
jgi:hypothetical protein